MRYVVAELKPGEKGGYCPRGAVKQLWGGRSREAIIAGAAETGKTYGCCQYADALLWKYAGAQGVLLRKTYSSLVGSALMTYRRVLASGMKDGERSPIVAYGGERPEWFDYPNGSRLWVGGLDNAQKILSSERDFFYVNQAEELSLDEWETITTRATGRGAVMPYTRVFGDCNPTVPTHWIKSRAGLELLESRHEDNPVLYDDEGNITEQGKITMSVLDALTGARRLRLRFGKWVQAEGVVYEGWDPAIHIIPAFDVPKEWPRYWVVDFGYTNPFVCLWAAEDPDGRFYIYREIYHTQRLVEDHAKDILRLSADEPGPRLIICDHDAEDRATLERHINLPTVGAIKNVRPGIQQVASALRVQGDGKPRLFIFDNSLVEEDPALRPNHKPTRTAEEMDGYVWDTRMNRRQGEEPLKVDDHGADCVRYLCSSATMTAEVQYGRNIWG